jgi:RHS repeat-associated protein
MREKSFERNFYITDHLGTVRVEMDVMGNVISTHDFEPFGVELPPSYDPQSKLLYTGQERDNYTNYDYMHFRYYSSSIGRFLKPDNIIPDITNPQNWNAYSYVKGNPINYNDPSGHFINPPHSTKMALFGGPGVEQPLASEYGGFWENPLMAMPAVDAVNEFRAPGYSTMESLMAQGYFNSILSQISLMAGPANVGKSGTPAPLGDPLYEMLRQMQIESNRELMFIIAQVSPSLTLVLYQYGPALNFAGTVSDIMEFIRSAFWRYPKSSSESSLRHYFETGQVTGFILGHTHPGRETLGCAPYYENGTITTVCTPKYCTQTFDADDIGAFKWIKTMVGRSGNMPPMTSIILIPGEGPLQSFGW